MSEDILWSSLREQVAAVTSSRVSAEALASGYLERIARIDPAYHAFVTLNPRALEDAREVDRQIAAGATPGLLAGACIAVKDNFATECCPTRAGTPDGLIEVPPGDAHLVRRLRAEGAVVIGKTRMHQLAWGNITAPANNPWSREHVPGGSSGGSAVAVALGLCAGALGSDTGGSVRIPAAFCGTAGFKPTLGLLGRSGIVSHSWSLDHPGPITRTTDDAALMMAAMVGADAGDPYCQGRTPAFDLDAAPLDVTGLRIGVIRNHFGEQVSVEVRDACTRATDWLVAQGARITAFDVPELRFGLGAIFAIELVSASAHFDALVQSGRSAELEPDVRAMIEMGRLVSGVDYLHAERLRAVLCARFAEIFSSVDILITPTSPITAWPHGASEIEIDGRVEKVLAASWRFTYPFNLTGLPALSVPCGRDSDGLPIGLQIVAGAFDDERCLRAGLALERAGAAGFERPVGS